MKLIVLCRYGERKPEVRDIKQEDVEVELKREGFEWEEGLTTGNYTHFSGEEIDVMVIG